MPNSFLERKWELFFLFISSIIQILLGFFLGHYYDMRIFMASGYSVNSGLNPYLHYDFSNIFNNPLLMGSVPGIGYPPPWPLLMGIIYRATFFYVNNIFFYNLAIKLPIIISNILLAYLVKHILSEMKSNSKIIRNSWLFILFNPFLILTSSAWGQFDTIVTLFFLTALYFLYSNKSTLSAISLALSVSLKPITLPLFLIPALYTTKNRAQKIKYYFVFSTITLLLCVVPFFIFQWNTQTFFINWNAHFRNAGALSPFNLLELFEGSFRLPQDLEFLGLIWLPAVIIGYIIIYRNPPKNLQELIKSGLFLILVFFLTRTWLSEQNVNLILPLLVIVSANSQFRNSKSLHLSWIIPLIFMLLNTSFFQLFFLVDNNILQKIELFDENFRTIRLISRFFIVVIWQILSWNIVKKLKNNQKQSTKGS